MRAPAQLPADVDTFIGRSAELAELDRFMACPATAHENKVQASAGTQAPAVIISVVSGTAGVGKTALALRWAHLARDRFPDGQLYVNLRGYDLDQPIPADEVPAGFLRALGYAGEIPAGSDERAAAYRTLADGRRMLIVLDNAATAEQVRPLLPGSPACMVLVTSRDSLAGLVARHGARRLELDLLPHDDAVRLLRELVGDRVAAEPGAAAALAGQCARLPLALRVAAELAIEHPAMTLSELVAELANEQRRLDLLDAAGDSRTAVCGVFSWSFRHLPAAAARVFRLIGVHPGADTDDRAVAALAAISLDESRRMLGVLARAHLVRHEHGGRYSQHDLLRSYAAQVAAVEEPDDERRSAQTRLLDFYLAEAAAVMDVLYPAERNLRPRDLPPDRPALAWVPRHAAEALAWLDAERVTLGAMIAHAAAHGWHHHATRLAAILFRYLDTCRHYSEASAMHGHAQAAARLSGDTAAEATALSNLGVAAGRQGRFGIAVDSLEQALALFRETGDRPGQARALGNLGDLAWRQGNCAQAADRHEQALALFRQIGDRFGEADALGSLGSVYERQGDGQRAASFQDQALTLFGEIGDSPGEADAFNRLGEVRLVTARPAAARALFAAALVIADQIADKYEQARAHDGLGRCHEAEGNVSQARYHWRCALGRYTELGLADAARRAYQHSSSPSTAARP